MRVLLITLIVSLSSILFSQKDALKKANEFISESDFRSALLQLNEIPNIGSSAPLMFKRAKCYYEINELDKALAELTRVENMGYKDEETLFYKGRVLHHKGNFRLAIQAYKDYLRKTSFDNPKGTNVREHIRHAGAALDILYIDPISTIENAGPTINSRYEDQKLIQSSGKSNRYYFSSNRAGRDQKVSSYLSKSYSIDASADMNIFFTDRLEYEWSSAERLNDRSVNTYKDDILVDLSMDGTSLYVRRGNDKKELLAQSSSLEMKNRVHALFELVEGEGNLHFFNDSTVIFSSNQLDETHGGFDLYVTAFVNDKWLQPKNLGREINSAYDETSPYLTNDGSQIFFSSNRSFSVGGFDIFSSSYMFEQGKWTSPKNIGLPINSPGNETHFRLSDDGLIGIYTSDRKDGYGGNDLYFAYLNERSEHQLFTVRDLGFIDYPDFYLKKIIEPNSVATSEALDYKSDKAQETESSENNFSSNPKVVSLPVLFPNQDGELITNENIHKLDRLADIIKSTEDIHFVEVMSYADKDGIAEYNLFLSIKNAEKILDALVSRGVSTDKIHLKGFGNFLPLIKSSVKEAEILKMNTRIEFKINLPQNNILVEHQPLDISRSFLNKGYDIFRTLIDDAISYKIQIATVRQMYRGTALKLYNDVQVEKDPKTGNYMYSIGLYDDFLEANSIMRELSERGITALKIVPFVDGLRVEEKDLVNFATQYPELKEYIRSITFTETEE